MKKINIILKKLKELYPNVKTGLEYKNPYHLLIATILSAQCTDKQVNKVTKVLFKKFPKIENIAYANIKKIEKIIYSTGFYHNKAKNIKECSRQIIEDYNSKIPNDLNKLIKLKGVGRKTANVVLGAIFNIPGIVVDTHVKRISKRLGIAKGSTPEIIERELMKIIPKKYWNDFSLQLIYFGRETCKAIKPNCNECLLNNECIFNKDGL